MERKKFGSTDMEVSILGFGGAEIGFEGADAATVERLLGSALDAGLNMETSINIADQEAIELTLPKARERGMGVIAKRPIANTSWKYDSLPNVEYHQAYWERLQKLQYDFLNAPMQEVVSTALRFTLAQPGVCTAIVGTAKPDRWVENATLVAQGRLPEETVQAIRRRWTEVVGADWIGLE
ncbi:hypothetical protein [Paenibacillus sp.]|uniref:hypothetical protein n=1 Tax=Paenibacillus sp. TaxID=58172 RepID=UPI0028122AB9|nr:hypothetical protein [Paenibacillus sp.]